MDGQRWIRGGYGWIGMGNWNQMATAFAASVTLLVFIVNYLLFVAGEMESLFF